MRYTTLYSECVKDDLASPFDEVCWGVGGMRDPKNVRVALRTTLVGLWSFVHIRTSYKSSQLNKLRDTIRDRIGDAIPTYKVSADAIFRTVTVTAATTAPDVLARLVLRDILSMDVEVPVIPERVLATCRESWLASKRTLSWQVQQLMHVLSMTTADHRSFTGYLINMNHGWVDLRARMRNGNRYAPLSMSPRTPLHKGLLPSRKVTTKALKTLIESLSHERAWWWDQVEGSTP